MAKPCTNMRELRDRVAQHYGKKPIQYRLYIPMPASGDEKERRGA